MVEKNKCVDCGKNILDLRKRKCEECVKKPKKKHLDNFQILAKYSFSIATIDRNIENLMIKINNELGKLSNLKEKFNLNNSNEDLLNAKMGELVSLKEKLMNCWKRTRDKNSLNLSY